MLKIIFNHFSDHIQKFHWIIWYKWIIFVPGILLTNILYYLPHNSCILASFTVSHNNCNCFYIQCKWLLFGRLMKGKFLNLSMAGIASAMLHNVILRKYCKSCLILSAWICRVGFFFRRQVVESKFINDRNVARSPQYIRLRILKQRLIEPNDRLFYKFYKAFKTLFSCLPKR